MITFKEFLRNEVKPALGCTEPGAVALAAARASEELDGIPEKLIINLSESIFKNGMDVGIPGTNGHRGNAIAGVLGALVKNSKKGLQVLSMVDMEMVDQALQMVQDEHVKVNCLHGVKDIFIEVIALENDQQVKVIIEKNHSHISRVEKNGQILSQLTSFSENSDPKVSVFDLFYGKKLEDILSLADEMDEEDQEFLLMGAEMNRKVAEIGIKGEGAGLKIGNAIRKLIDGNHLCGDPIHYVRLLASAASDARMSGLNVPVMSSAGSGNHGLVAILPVAYVGENLQSEPKKIAKALAISHLVTSYIKSHIGRLSPTCGCAIAAGSGAAAGLTYLYNGSMEQAKMAIKTLLSSLMGLICDGAKESCALKVGVAASEAMMTSQMAMQGIGITYAQGIIAEETKDTAINLGKLDHEGMKDMDKIIINLLENRHCKH